MAMFSFALTDKQAAFRAPHFTFGHHSGTMEGGPAGVVLECDEGSSENILRAVLHNRGIASVRPLRAQGTEQYISVLPRDAHDDYLTVESLGTDEILGCEGERVQLFLQYTEENKVRYYIGEAQLVSQHRENGLLRARLKLIGSLLQGQRRRFMRVSPPSSMIQVADVRYMSPAGPRQLAEGGATTPSAVWYALPPKRIVVCDISAGGLRASVPAGEVGGALLARGDMMLFSMGLIRKHAEPLLLMVMGRLLKLEQKQVPGLGLLKFVSMRFEHHAERPKFGGPQRWLPVNPGMGVTSFLPWIAEVQFATRKLEPCAENQHCCKARNL